MTQTPQTLLYLANLRVPTEKAHGIQIMNMCNAFSASGLRVRLVVPRRHNSLHNDPFEYYDIPRSFTITKLPCIDLTRYGRLGFYIQSLSFGISALIYCLFIRQKDIIYSREDTPIAGLFFRKRFFWELHFQHRSPLARLVARHSSGLIVLTEGLFREYAPYRTNNKTLLIAPDAVDIEKCTKKHSMHTLRTTHNLPLNKHIVGYIGKWRTMGVSKGIPELIRAFAIAQKKEKDLFLLLVGAVGKDVMEAQALIDHLDIPLSSYTIVPHTKHTQAIAYMQASNVLIMNYPITEYHAYHLSPLKMFEYMACRRPIIAPDLPCIREILNEENALLCAPGNPEDFAHALVSLMHEPTQNTKRRIATAFAIAQKYTWKRRVKTIMRFIKENQS